MAINKNKINDAALKFVQKGQLKKAIKEYDKILADDPSDVRTLLKKGDLLVRAGEKSEAVDTYLKVANAYSQQGFHLKAVAVFKQILKLDESRVEVNLRLAEEYQNLGITGDAMSHLQIIAAYYDQQGMVRESLDILRRMVELDPENVASRIKLAEMYSREKMLPEAVEEFTQAADYLKNANRIEDYIKVAERLIFHDQSNLVVVKELAGIYLQRGDTKRALGKLQVCFKADPRDLDTLGMLAMAFQELGQISKTISVYKEMAKIYQDAGAMDEVQQVYRRVLEISPDDAEARQALGMEAAAPASAAGGFDDLDAGGGDFSQDAQGTEVATGLSDAGQMTMPGGPPGGGPPAGQEPEAEGGHLAEADRESLSRLLTETDVYIKYGLTNKAYEHLQRVFEMDPNNVEAHEKLKDLYVAAGQMEHAAQELATLTHLNLRRGRTDAARTHLRALLGIAPNHPMAAPLAAQLEVQAPLEAPAGAPGPEGGGGEDFAVLEPSSPDVMVAQDGEVVQVDEPAAAESVEVPIDVIDIDVPADLEEDSGQFEPAGAAAAGPEVIQLEDDPAAPPAELPDFDDLDGSLLDAVDGAAGLEGEDGPGLDEDVALVKDASPEDLALIESVEDDDNSDLPTRVADLEELDLSSLKVRPEGAPPPTAGPVEVFELDDYDVGEETLETTSPVRPPESGAAPPVEPELLPFEEDDPFFEEATARPGPGPREVGPGPGPREVGPVPAALDPDLLGVDELVAPEAGPGGTDFEGEHSTQVSMDRPESAPPAEPETTLPRAAPPSPPRPEEEGRPFEEETTGPGRQPVPTPPAAFEEPVDLSDNFEEIDFFIQQNLLDEARDGLAVLRAEHPDHPGVQERLAHLERLLAGEAPTPAVAPEEVTDGFDLAKAISSEASDDLSSAPLTDEFQYSVDDVLSEFKKGVEKVVAKEDSATHFDLGIAYKEMGLLDDAIGEFSLAAQDTQRQAEALTMVGLCLSEKGQFSDAINRFKDALHVPSLDEDKATGLYYEMGVVYEKLKEAGEALYYYKKVVKRDPKFRDVAQRVRALAKGGVEPPAREGAPAADAGGGEQGKAQGKPVAKPAAGQAVKKDKISYM